MREARETLARTSLELERKTHEVEQFVYTVSHDLRSPLVTINGFLALLEEGVEAGDHAAVDRAIDRIRRSAARMSEMIEALMRLSRVGRVARNTTVVDVGHELGELLLLYEARLAERGAVVEIAESLPPVRANRDLLVQAFDNVLANALEHGGEGPGLRIRIDHRLTAREIQYRVRDNGRGVPQEYQTRIFRVFERLDPDIRGNGMGLAIVDRVLSAHDGRAWVESEPGQGATFVLAFPREAGIAVDDAAEEA